MPRYFFHVHNSLDVAIDDEGEEVDDLKAARRIAIEAARSILGEELRKGRIDLRGYIIIADDRGTAHDKVNFADAVDLRSDMADADTGRHKGLP